LDDAFLIVRSNERHDAKDARIKEGKYEYSGDVSMYKF